jgi:hypothetical protein
MTVSQEDKDAMARLLAVMNGESAPSSAAVAKRAPIMETEEIGGPGVITQREITAMADVLGKLNKVTQQVMFESNADTESRMAVRTMRTDDVVKVGEYQIDIVTNERRLAGKQYYRIEHTGSSTVIANDITLYEVALAVVKLLNGNAYVNDNRIRRLFEIDERYTGHRVDAMTARIHMRRAEKAGDKFKQDILESRYQKSLDEAMRAKGEIKKALISGGNNNR